MDTICCIIVTYNCDYDFIKTFTSVYNQVNKVVIVDNGSNKKTIDMLEKLKREHNIEIILCFENIGIAGALNKGVKYALENNYQWVLTLDHDSVLDKNMVNKLLDARKTLSKEKQDITLSLFPRYVEANLNVEAQLSKNNNYIKNIEAGITSGNLVHRNVFERVGLFEEKLFIDLVDYDFCFRALQLGFEMIEVGDAFLFHTLGDTDIRKFLTKEIKCTNHSPLRKYYATRNRMYCWNKYKNSTKSFIKQDKKNFRLELMKILLVEQRKCDKFRMIFKGYRDYKKNIFGKYVQKDN